MHIYVDKIKCYIYDMTGSTSEPWTGNFSGSMTGPVLKTLVSIINVKPVQ